MSVVVVVVMVVLPVVAVVVMEVVVKVEMVTVVKVVLDVHVGVGGEDVTGGHVAVVSHLAATCTAKKKNCKQLQKPYSMMQTRLRRC